MEYHYLGTAVLKKHQISVRRIRLSLTKRWVSKIDTQQLRGHVALPCPVVAIHLNYMMDKKRAVWTVLGQLKGSLPVDHAPHPLTYSGFTVLVKPYQDRTRDGDVGNLAALPQLPVLLRLSQYVVSVYFSHNYIDCSRPKSRDQNYHILANQKSNGQRLKHEIDSLYKTEYVFTSYLNMRVKLKVGHTTMRFIKTRSGWFPVASSDPQVILCTFMRLCGSDYFRFFAEGEMYSKEFTTSKTVPGELSLLSNVIETFDLQERFEALSIAKRLEDGTTEKTITLVPSIKKLLKQKLSHLRALNRIILEPLLALIGTETASVLARIEQMKGSLALIDQLTTALQGESASVQDLVSLCNPTLTTFYSAYRVWWKAFFESMSTNTTNEFHRQLQASSSEVMLGMTVPDISATNDTWTTWTNKLEALLTWVAYYRGKHSKNLSSNEKEQDHAYLGAIGKNEFRKMFHPSFQLYFRNGNLITGSSFYHEGRLLLQDVWDKRSETLRCLGVHTTRFDSLALLKQGVEYNLKFDNDGVYWERVKLKDLTAQTLFGYKRAEEHALRQQIRLQPAMNRSISTGNNADPGIHHLIVMLNFRQNQRGLLSVSLSAPYPWRLTPVEELLPGLGSASSKRDHNYYEGHVHDQQRVFPLAFFEPEQLVLFAQLSLLENKKRTKNKAKYDMGVYLYAFRHKPNQTFDLIETNRFHELFLHSEELRWLDAPLGWVSLRNPVSRFYFRWREIRNKKVGLWITGYLCYSLYLFSSRNKFVFLGKRGSKSNIFDATAALMECRLGPEQSSIGISTVRGLSPSHLTMECWLYELRL